MIRADGLIISDSSHNGGQSQLMDNYADRPEIRAALANGQGSSVRRSATTDLHYV